VRLVRAHGRFGRDVGDDRRAPPGSETEGGRWSGPAGQLGFEAPGRGVGCEAGLRASWATVLSCELGRGRGVSWAGSGQSLGR
jgi:hypothetical protein